MKKLNRKLIRGTNWALVGILSPLGFSGCDKIFQMEYGSPMANFKVTGRVTDEEGRPLSGVRIVAPNVDGKWGKQSDPSRHDLHRSGREVHVPLQCRMGTGFSICQTEVRGSHRAPRL